MVGHRLTLGVPSGVRGPSGITCSAFALRDNVTVYDALYLALAEALDAPLLTLDGALAGVPGCDTVVELLD